MRKSSVSAPPEPRPLMTWRTRKPLRSANAARDPIWRLLAETDLVKSRRFHHTRDFRTGETLLQHGSESIQGIGPHGIETQVSITAQRKISHIHTKRHGHPCGSR